MGSVRLGLRHHQFWSSVHSHGVSIIKLSLETESTLRFGKKAPKSLLSGKCACSEWTVEYFLVCLQNVCPASFRHSTQPKSSSVFLKTLSRPNFPNLEFQSSKASSPDKQLARRCRFEHHPLLTQKTPITVPNWDQDWRTQKITQKRVKLNPSSNHGPGIQTVKSNPEPLRAYWNKRLNN